MSRRRPRIEEFERMLEEEEEADGEEETDTDERTTSITDLTKEADPKSFDTTFTDSDADLGIQGRFDPVAGNKQVIPRVAYTINFQMVYNESRGRWEPQKKSEVVGGAVSCLEATGGGTQTVQDGATGVVVEYNSIQTDQLDGADLSRNAIIVPASGTYMLAPTARLRLLGTSGDVKGALQVNGSGVGEDDESSGSAAEQSVGAVKALELSEGDEITFTVSNNTGSDGVIQQSPTNTWLSVIQGQTATT